MTPPDAPDLFSAAGLVLDVTPPRKPRKAKRQRKPTPAERAATARALGARRPACPCDDGVRVRIGGPRDLHPAKVKAFPLSRNAALLQDAVQKLPGFHDDSFLKKWASTGRNLEKKLIRHGIPEDAAYDASRDLLNAAYDVRRIQANKEAKTQ